MIAPNCVRFAAQMAPDLATKSSVGWGSWGPGPSHCLSFPGTSGALGSAHGFPAGTQIPEPALSPMAPPPQWGVGSALAWGAGAGSARCYCSGYSSQVFFRAVLFIYFFKREREGEAGVGAGGRGRGRESQTGSIPRTISAPGHPGPSDWFVLPGSPAYSTHTPSPKACGGPCAPLSTGEAKTELGGRQAGAARAVVGLHQCGGWTGSSGLWAPD